MDDLISRQSALDEVVSWLKDRITDAKNGKSLTDRLKDLPSAPRLSEEDLQEIQDRFGDFVRFVGEDMTTGEEKRWNMKDDLISRQAAIDEIEERKFANGYRNVAVISELNRLEGYIMRLPSTPRLSEEDLQEIQDRFGDFVRFVGEDMTTGYEKRWNMKDDLISRQAAIDAVNSIKNLDAKARGGICFKLIDLPSAQPERLTDDDFETIRIHLSAHKEKLCNQNRYKEAEEYQRIIDRFLSFASAQPEQKTDEVDEDE